MLKSRGGIPHGNTITHCITLTSFNPVLLALNKNFAVRRTRNRDVLDDQILNMWKPQTGTSYRNDVVGNGLSSPPVLD